MRSFTPQIALHQRDGKNDPIFGIDAHPKLSVLATAGSDNEVKIWILKIDDEEDSPLAFRCAISAHSGSVNAVRFSPNGSLLASCSDDHSVCIMECKPHRDWTNLDTEKDLQISHLRHHSQDVIDIAWSSDSKSLVSGCIDGKVIVWNVSKRAPYADHVFDDHGHYVQGVAWDPFGHFFCSESADRTMKVYKLKPRNKPNKGKRQSSSAPVSRNGDTNAIADNIVTASGTNSPTPDTFRPSTLQQPDVRVFRFVLHADVAKRTYYDPVQTNFDKQEDTTTAQKTTESSASIKKKSRQIFLDDSVPTFFRRPDWSPDGSFLVAPTGFSKSSETDEENAGQVVKGPTTFVYLRGVFHSPAAQFSAGSKPSIGVRFCPKLFKLREQDEKPWFDASYRMVFAVATLQTILVYDTQSSQPIAVAEKLHFASLTDLSWTANGLSLLVCSSDGYCSVIVFTKQELGETIDDDETRNFIKLSGYSLPLLESSPASGNAFDTKDSVITKSSAATEKHLVAAAKQTEPVRVVNGLRRITPLEVTPSAPMPQVAESVRGVDIEGGKVFGGDSAPPYSSTAISSDQIDNGNILVPKRKLDCATFSPSDPQPLKKGNA